MEGVMRLSARHPLRDCPVSVRRETSYRPSLVPHPWRAHPL